MNRLKNLINIFKQINGTTELDQKILTTENKKYG